MQNEWQRFINTLPISSDADAALLCKANIITDLSRFGLVKITGPDAKKFLQGQLTCNIDEVTEGQARLGAHCNPQGRIISLFRVFFYQDSFLLQMPLDVIPIALVELKKYAVFFKTTISDESNNLVRIGYSGIASTGHLTELLDDIPDQINSAVESNSTYIVKPPGIVPRYFLTGDFMHISAIWKLLSTQAQIAADTVWHYINIISGIPQIYAATSGKFLPHEINLQVLDGISFNKGCFTGQEIIARMQYRGKLKKRMFHARVNTENAPRPGDDIYREMNNAFEACGNIIDVCEAKPSNFQLLVLADIDDANTTPLFAAQNKLQPIEFLSLPYET